MYPAVAAAARRAGAESVALIDVGSPTGLNAHVDLVGITYSDGTHLGDRSSPVQLSSSVVGNTAIPRATIPRVAGRARVHRNPLEPAEGLGAVEPAHVFRGDPVRLCPVAVDAAPRGALPVVITTWAVSRLRDHRREQLIDALVDAARTRTVVHVSVEGVGVVPGVPTLGDRPASGHSIVAVGLYGPATRTVEPLARCFARGRWIEWLVDG